MPGVAVRVHVHQQGLWRPAEPIALRNWTTRWDYERPGVRARDRRNVVDRSVDALALRRVEGRGGRDGAGIRPLLRDADLLPPRRLPDRTESLRRRAARVSELSGEVQSRRREYRVFGYKGKQVRDNIHSQDVAAFIHAFWKTPRVAEVYNIGGGKANSCSILEAFELVAWFTQRRAGSHLRRRRPRRGDHICYYSDLAR